MDTNKSIWNGSTKSKMPWNFSTSTSPGFDRIQLSFPNAKSIAFPRELALRMETILESIITRKIGILLSIWRGVSGAAIVGVRCIISGS